MQSITILGSTGSIGVQALDIIAAHPQRFNVFALTANRNIDQLLQQCQQFNPNYAVVVDKQAAQALSQRIKATQLTTTVLAGEKALSEVAAASEVDTVLSGIVGAAALLPTMSAIQAGKRVLLANKESLVMAGELMMSALAAHQATLLPVDSEHNATLQCLPGGFLPGLVPPAGVRSIALTASGGPFRLTPLNALSDVTPEQAVAHPNWSMGAKISVDSATMMNKGLEVIEARWLFAMSPNDINVMVHPQSKVHAFVQYEDGSVLSHLAPPDMHVPLAHVLAWPDRIDSGVAPINLMAMTHAEFYPPDLARYPCLSLAYQALETGGTATTILNAANEVAVEQFLSSHLRFDQIAAVVAETLERVPAQPANDLDSIMVADQQARRCASDLMANPSLARQALINH